MIYERHIDEHALYLAARKLGYEERKKIPAGLLAAIREQLTFGKSVDETVQFLTDNPT